MSPRIDKIDKITRGWGELFGESDHPELTKLTKITEGVVILSIQVHVDAQNTPHTPCNFVNFVDSGRIDKIATRTL